MNQREIRPTLLTASDRGGRNHHRIFEMAALLCAGFLLAVSALRLADHFEAAWLGPILFAGALAYFAADLVSGLVHWACDRFGSPNTPFLGENFIAPFREHHREPEAITQKGFVEVNGNTAIALTPILILVHVSLPLGTGHSSPFGHIFMASLCGWLIATNQFHKLAHQPPNTNSPLIRWLQRKQLILPQIHHGRHHRAPFDRHYCITNGRLDPWLEKLGVWIHLEAALTRLSHTRNEPAENFRSPARRLESDRHAASPARPLDL
ncbi:fatty acid desaturase family protein [Myxococcota bacterium]|nr:fatty acid desaturase family protein [Myxococcota bacterium]